MNLWFGTVASSRRSSIVTSGLVLNLDAGNSASYPGSGTTWTDLSGLGSNATLTNGPTYNSANNGQIVFDGIDDYAITTSFSGNFPTGSSLRTLCAFIRPTAISGGREVFGIGDNIAMGSRSALWLDPTNGVGIEFLNSARLTSSWPGINNWFYLCASIPSTNAHSAIIYINGNLVTSSAFGSDVTLNTPANQCVVATVPGAIGAHPFQGSIGAVHLYNRALSAAEISQNFNALRSRYGL